MAVAQPPKPGPSGGRSAADRLAHCPQRSQRPRVDTEGHWLATTKPGAAVCPVINLGRVQHRGAARHERAPDCPLHRPAALRRRVRFFAQVWMVWPFRHGVAFTRSAGGGLPRRNNACYSPQARPEGKLPLASPSGLYQNLLFLGVGTRYSAAETRAAPAFLACTRLSVPRGLYRLWRGTVAWYRARPFSTHLPLVA